MSEGEREKEEGRRRRRERKERDIEHTLRYIQKDKHIVLYDYNTIVMKHFVSKETKKEKKIKHSFP